MARLAHHPVALVLGLVRTDDREEVVALKKVGNGLVRVVVAAASDGVVYVAVGRAAGGVGLVVKVIERVRPEQVAEGSGRRGPAKGWRTSVTSRLSGLSQSVARTRGSGRSRGCPRV
jgi:hypothetical protein